MAKKNHHPVSAEVENNPLYHDTYGCSVVTGILLIARWLLSGRWKFNSNWNTTPV